MSLVERCFDDHAPASLDVGFGRHLVERRLFGLGAFARFELTQPNHQCCFPFAVLVVVNVTVTNPTAPSYLTLWPDGTQQPLASDLNFMPGQTVPNLVVLKLGPSSPSFDIYNAAGSTDVVIDLVGFYGTPQAAPNGAPRALVMHLSTRGGEPGPRAANPRKNRRPPLSCDFGMPL